MLLCGTALLSFPHVSPSMMFSSTVRRSETVRGHSTHLLQAEVVPRSKDPLRNLIPPASTRPPAATSSRRQTQKARHAWRAEKVLGDVVKGLQWLDSGGSGRGGPAKGANMTNADHCEMDRLRETCSDFVDRYAEALGAGFGLERAALKRLCGEGPGYGDARRGDVVPLAIENLSLPKSDRAFDIRNAFPEMEQWENWMLREEMPSLGEVMSLGSYSDRRLDTGSPVLTELAMRLWRRGLVTPVRRKGKVGVTAFAVAKDGGKQRLVFDMRRCNAQFKNPPGMVMGSPRALSYLDLSDAVLGEDEVGASFGDVECFFYSLRGGGLCEWLWLQGVDFDLFRELAIREGADARTFQGCDGLGFTGLPMGFTWAPYLAQGCLEFLLQEADMPAEGRILHGKDAPGLQCGAPLSMPYIDDFLGLRRHASAEDCIEACKGDLERCRTTLKSHGLNCHKDGVGQRVVSLGVELSLTKGNRTAKPQREKFVQLLMATRAAVRSPQLSGRQLSVLLGHWAWWLMLRPPIFSVLDDVYAFTRSPEGRDHEARDVPDTVRGELRMLLRLAPFVRADLSWPVDSRVYMSDACEVAGAACYSTVEPELARSFVQTSASWEGACEPPGLDFCNPSRWRVGARTTWKRDGQIDALEGEAHLLGLRHAVRDRRRRRRRKLDFVDNQALLGCVRKGRSSARRLLRVCRRVASLVLFAELRLHLRYVPTDRNVADAPSRGAHGAGCEAWTPMPAQLRRASKAACDRERSNREARLASKALAGVERHPAGEVAAPPWLPLPRPLLVQKLGKPRERWRPGRLVRSVFSVASGSAFRRCDAGADTVRRRCPADHELAPTSGRRSIAMRVDAGVSRVAPRVLCERARACRGCGVAVGCAETTMSCADCRWDLCWLCWRCS